MAFAVIDRVREEMLNRVGFSDLLKPGAIGENVVTMALARGARGACSLSIDGRVRAHNRRIGDGCEASRQRGGP
jgi:hypothetical protein